MVNMSDTETLEDIKSPKNTSLLLSHSEEEEMFLSSFKSEKLHHSWLIVGPKGIGKATLAYRIARYIFSINNPNILKNLNLDIDTTTPIITDTHTIDYDDDEEEDDTGFFGADDLATPPTQTTTTPSVVKPSLDEFDTSSLKLQKSHPIFERLIAGGLTDLMIVECEYTDTNKIKLKTEITVDQIRKLKEFYSKTSSEDGYRVAIIDSIDEMNTNSRNALLKILEEAPRDSLLLLICNNINGLLPTIKSRCRILKLSPIDDENMKRLLKNEIDNVTDEEINEIIDMSSGSIGNALNIYNYKGLTLQTKFFEIIPEILSKKNTRILEIINMINSDGKVFQLFKNIFIKFISDAIKYKSAIETDTVDTTSYSQPKRVALDSISNYYKNIEALFKIREVLLKDFHLQSELNLDTTAVIITSFERLKNVY